MNDCLLVVHAVERARPVAQLRLVHLPVPDADCMTVYRVERVCLTQSPTASIAFGCIRPVDSVPLQADRGIVCYTVFMIAGQIRHGTSVAVSTAVIDTDSSSASRSIAGSSFPRFSALRRIPAHAFALK